MKSSTFRNIVANVLIVAFGFVGMKLLIFLNSVFPFPVFSSPYVLAIILIASGLAVRIWATIQFTKNDVEILEMNNHPRLVVHGAFKYSRNPLYLGIMLSTLGFVLLSGSFIGVIFIIVFFIFWNFLIIKKEEKDLEIIFGQEYLNYKSRTRRWI